MIVLDTNVASELGEANPNPHVAAWFARQNLEDLFITAVSEAELLFGTERLPISRRRNELTTADDRMINDVLSGRVLPFDRASARAYAEIRAYRERAGLSIQDRDCMIAAIARSNRATVATRDIGSFENCGIDVVNPWTE